MRIAVCDDEQIWIESIITVLEDYSIERKIDLEYKAFGSYAELEPETDDFDIFIMDYQTPEIDGLTFAGRIREKYGNKKTIIFLTSYQEVVYDAFAVRAHRFLVKPIDKIKFYEAMDSVIENSRVNATLSVKCDNKIEIIPTEDILYIEVADKESYICLADEQIVCHKPISQLEEELIPHGFFRIHRAYLVNLSKIRSFDTKAVEFSNGETIQMSRRRYKDFCAAYLDLNSR